jgi:hypothetical protein
MNKRKLRQHLLEGKTPKKNGKMLKKLHELDDRIEDFVDGLEDEIMKTEGDNPVFVKKAQQLLADMSKEYSEFIMALRAIVNAVDRREKVIPMFDKQEGRVRDIRDGAGNGGAPPEGEEAPPEEDLPPEEGEEEADDEFELKVAKKDSKKKKK